MAVNSSILAWRSPWTEEPDGLQSTGSHRVRHDWSDLTHSYLTLLLQSKSSLDNTETSEHGCAIIKLYLWTQKFQLHIIFTLFTLFFFEFFSTISKCKIILSSQTIKNRQWISFGPWTIESDLCCISGFPVHYLKWTEYCIVEGFDDEWIFTLKVHTPQRACLHNYRRRQNAMLQIQLGVK